MRMNMTDYTCPKVWGACPCRSPTLWLWQIVEG